MTNMNNLSGPSPKTLDQTEKVLWRKDDVRVVKMNDYDDCVIETYVDGEWDAHDDLSDAEAYQLMCMAFMDLWEERRKGEAKVGEVKEEVKEEQPVLYHCAELQCPGRPYKASDIPHRSCGEFPTEKGASERDRREAQKEDLTEEGPHERYSPTIDSDEDLINCCAQFVSYAAGVNADCVFRDNIPETTLERIANARDYLDAIETYISILAGSEKVRR